MPIGQAIYTNGEESQVAWVWCNTQGPRLRHTHDPFVENPDTVFYPNGDKPCRYTQAKLGTTSPDAVKYRSKRVPGAPRKYGPGGGRNEKLILNQSLDV